MALWDSNDLTCEKIMILSEKDLNHLCETAKQAALDAGKYINSVDSKSIKVEHKDSGSSLASLLVTDVDRYCDKLIGDYLAESCDRYNLAILSEESAENHEQKAKNRFNQPYFWCVDPLDGTLPFTQGHAGYAVCIALVSHSGVPVIGVVYDPVNKHLFTAIQNGAAFKNQTLIRCTPELNDNKNCLTVFADISFKQSNAYETLQGSLGKVAKTLGASDYAEVYGAGGAMNACSILETPLSCYFKQPKKSIGGGSLWDFAASACIVKEAGAWVSDFYGEPLDLNRKDSSYMNHKGVLFASCERVARAVLGLDTINPAIK